MSGLCQRHPSQLSMERRPLMAGLHFGCATAPPAQKGQKGRRAEEQQQQEPSKARPPVAAPLALARETTGDGGCPWLAGTRRPAAISSSGHTFAEGLAGVGKPSQRKTVLCRRSCLSCTALCRAGMG